MPQFLSDAYEGETPGELSPEGGGGALPPLPPIPHLPIVPFPVAVAAVG